MPQVAYCCLGKRWRRLRQNLLWGGIVFYVAAHQDDWQFFRGEQVYADLNTPDTRVIFIQTTAGNADLTDGWREARERGVIASIRAAIPAAPLKIDVKNILGHQITVYECANTANYCLRLPDSIGINSLKNLRDGVIDSLTAIDHSTTYYGWADFWLTLQEILETERVAIGSDHPWVNASDYNSVRNPGDHADHKATADALREFVANTYRRAWFASSYIVSEWPPNLDGAAYASKRAVFEAYSEAVLIETTKNGVPKYATEGEWDWWGDKSYVTLRDFNELDD
ncbi:MAG: hypothetical protein HOP02_07805 [Methylococcaceae bacterium]|nr:hypothetical protein [Methylococcaceae bacterium]